jgi:two-component system response regulator FlrC
MRVLIIGALNNYATLAAKIALSKGAKVSHVTNIEEGLDYARNGKAGDVILADLKLDIKTLVENLLKERINVPVLACGIAANPEEAALAIKNGAQEYIPLPPNPELIAAVFDAIAREDHHKAIFKDPKMEKVFELARRIAPSEASVLITGESGTGKEVVSRYIHAHSKRSGQPFVSINCAAIPENLLESELFGHEKGAFTGAVARRIGKFEEACGGTLLLDEITEMPPQLQAKLLRAIQERVIDRVGGNEPVKVDIRIIATSNRDMLKAVKENAFREDLYFRLNVVNIHLPPLRERPMDVLVLAEHFLIKFSELNHVPSKKLGASAHEALQNYGWRGNVRELENVIHRAVLLSTGLTIEVEDLMLMGESRKQTTGSNLVGRRMDDVEKEMIMGTLNQCLGNRTHAANILGISIRTLRNKLKEYDLEEGEITPSQSVG